MDEIVLILFLAIIVVLVVMVLLILTVMSSNKKDARAASDKFANLSPQVHLERSVGLIRKYEADKAKKHALAAFRNGDRAVKRQAVEILTNLHEVEKF